LKWQRAKRFKFEVFGNLERGHGAYWCNNSTKLIVDFDSKKLIELKRLEKIRNQAPILRNIRKKQ
jgi:hypothetical protein